MSTQLQHIRQWLETFPGWGKLQVDVLPPVPGQSAIFPQGVQELSRKEDLLGNTVIRLRSTFLLVRSGVHTCDENADWLIELADWVRRQSAQGLAPKLGEDLWLRVQEGRRKNDPRPGSSLYTAKLIAEYTLRYTQTQHGS